MSNGYRDWLVDELEEAKRLLKESLIYFEYIKNHHTEKFTERLKKFLDKE